MFNTVFAPPRFRPSFNVGCLLDIPTGYYETGAYGESILNGGLSSFTGIVARPNNFKTALAIYFMVRLRKACRETPELVYDTEGTLPIARFAAACAFDDYLKTLSFDVEDEDAEDKWFAHTDLSKYTGDEFFADFRTITEAKVTKDNEKKYTRTTPFLGSKGTPKQALMPSAALIDSFSKFQISTVDELYTKNKIGDSSNNTDAMQSGKAKKQMLNQVPQICARTGTYLVMTAHVGDIINVEMYPKDKRNLNYMERDTVLKGVSPEFYSLPNNVWAITKTRPLTNKEKMPEYPWDNKTAMKNDTDLTELTLMNLRGKSGMSGVPITLVVSQSDGLLPGLSEFHYCKEENRWGLGGNLQNYYFELLPDVSLSRTKVRQKVQTSYPLQRAAQFTSELLQIHQFHRQTDPDLLCDPKTLYDDLTAMGHNWETLLATRGYWTFQEEAAAHEYPFLSTRDLLMMRKGHYVPYWYTKEQFEAVKGHLTATAVENWQRAQG